MEIYKALELGYRLEKVFEVWHYDRWAQYDGKDPDTGLFTRYINSFLKLKAQASGKLLNFPSNLLPCHAHFRMAFMGAD